MEKVLNAFMIEAERLVLQAIRQDDQGPPSHVATSAFRVSISTLDSIKVLILA